MTTKTCHCEFPAFAGNVAIPFRFLPHYPSLGILTKRGLLRHPCLSKTIIRRVIPSLPHWGMFLASCLLQAGDPLFYPSLEPGSRLSGRDDKIGDIYNCKERNNLARLVREDIKQSHRERSAAISFCYMLLSPSMVNSFHAGIHFFTLPWALDARSPSGMTNQFRKDSVSLLRKDIYFCVYL
jgi:hypothetical protein